MNRKKILITFLTLLLSGCATGPIQTEEIILKSGMSKDEILTKVGRPRSTSEYRSASGKTEILTYGDCLPRCIILTFQDEKLVSTSRHN